MSTLPSPGPTPRSNTRELTEQYALGRPFGFTDEGLANEITTAAKVGDFAVSEFIHALLFSEVFRTK